MMLVVVDIADDENETQSQCEEDEEPKYYSFQIHGRFPECGINS